MLIARAFGATSGPVAVKKFEEREPPPAPGQQWRRRDHTQLVEVFRLSADGYVTLMIQEGRAQGQTIIREFWQLHREFTCVHDVKRAQA